MNYFSFVGKQSIFETPFIISLQNDNKEDVVLSWIASDGNNVYHYWYKIFEEEIIFLHLEETIYKNIISFSNENYALSTSNNVKVFSLENNKRCGLINLKNIKSMQFDSKNKLWLLSGETLFKTLPNSFGEYYIFQKNVKSFLLNENKNYILSRDDENNFTLVMNEGEESFIYRIGEINCNSRTHFSIVSTESYIYIYIQPKDLIGENNNHLIVLNKYDFNSIKNISVDAVSHLSIKDINLSRWKNNDVLFLCERNNNVYLCHYNSVNEHITPISLPQHVVINFVSSNFYSSIYYIAIEYSSNKPVRKIFEVTNCGNKFVTRMIFEDVGYKLVIIKNGDCIFYGLLENKLSILKFSRVSRDVKILHQTKTKYPCISGINWLSVKKDILNLNCKKEDIIVIYYPGAHKLAMSGMQPNMFQECICRLFTKDNSKDYQGVIINLPSSFSSENNFEINKDINEDDYLRGVITELHEIGFNKIVLCSGSLGSLSILKFLHNTNSSIPTILINPVYDYNVLKESLIKNEAIINKLFAKIDTDMLIIHSKEDEVTPWEHSKSFTDASVKRKLYTLENDNHIFRRSDSWEYCNIEIDKFIMHLEFS
ncbi:alpha/beta hydrolase [Xenorhabdus doucetiae]|uniref:Uncharacterized protein n=1 Tax=Xenorhabdus doucetiae TaxID=351671 RepID=A0A068QTM8_9GAMM|nr:alpha/beta hydrolase [Xenorhabdus doucetiae]TYP04075.1 hypothetical protein LY16_02249 [Xenorhabdus doucetiae]CDG18139.1 protein of unknown function [Xenorhabdus doucetiae]